MFLQVWLQHFCKEAQSVQMRLVRTVSPMLGSEAAQYLQLNKQIFYCFTGVSAVNSNEGINVTPHSVLCPV